MIGPRSAAVGEPVPGVYLFSSREAVETALLNWLGEELEDEAIVILQISPTGLLLQSFCGFELVSESHIDAKNVVGVLGQDFKSYDQDRAA